jgi:hypothetical protein
LWLPRCAWQSLTPRPTAHCTSLIKRTADPSRDASAAYSLALGNLLLARGGGPPVSLREALRARSDAAWLTLQRAAYPALLANAAVFTVDEAWLLTAFVRRRRRVAALQAALNDPSAAADVRRFRQAQAELVLLESDGEGEGVGVVHGSLLLASRTGAAVVAETLGAAAGTLLWPGWGTTIVGILASAVCWMV